MKSVQKTVLVIAALVLSACESGVPGVGRGGSDVGNPLQSYISYESAEDGLGVSWSTLLPNPAAFANLSIEQLSSVESFGIYTFARDLISIKSSPEGMSIDSRQMHVPNPSETNKQTVVNDLAAYCFDGIQVGPDPEAAYSNILYDTGWLTFSVGSASGFVRWYQESEGGNSEVSYVFSKGLTCVNMGISFISDENSGLAEIPETHLFWPVIDSFEFNQSVSAANSAIGRSDAVLQAEADRQERAEDEARNAAKQAYYNLQ